MSATDHLTAVIVVVVTLEVCGAYLPMLDDSCHMKRQECS